MTEKLVSAGETDAFVFATEGQMRRRGQGRHVSCTLLELDSQPDLKALAAALQETMRRHPMMGAKGKRTFPGPKLWYVKCDSAADAIPLSIWKENGAIFADGKPCESLESLIDFLLNDAGEELESPRRCNARVDVLAREDGSWWLVLTWRHIVLDGVGAEWLLREIAALCENHDGPSVSPSFSVPTGSTKPSLHERWKATRPMLDHLMSLVKGGIHSFARKGAAIGRVKFEYQVLTTEETLEIKQRAATVCGPLIQTPFFLACAIRAHDAVWRTFRGGPPEQLVAALPVQERPRGKAGPIFRNNVSVMFLHALREETSDLETLTAALLKRQQQMMRSKLAESFAEMQRWMMFLPGPVYAFFLEKQMKGATTSFHHSHTGSFAGGLERFAGAAIRNGFHIPGFYAPPGTGLFVSEKNGRMTVTVSWRDGVLTAEEAVVLKEAFLESLIGEPQPHGNV